MLAHMNTQQSNKETLRFTRVRCDLWSPSPMFPWNVAQGFFHQGIKTGYDCDWFILPSRPR